MAIRYSRLAERFLDAQPNSVRAKIINDVVWLHRNPRLAPDSLQILPYDMPPLIGKMFKDSYHWILFLTEEREQQLGLLVCNIGRIEDTPHLWRQFD